MTPRHDTVSLEPRAVHRIANGLGRQVTCLSGEAWITQTNDRRDIILEAGDSFVLDRPGLALVFAFGATTVAIGDVVSGAIAAAA